MRNILLFFAGVVVIVLSQTLFGSIGFYGVAACYSFALFFLFYGLFARAISFLTGLIISTELLGTVHFGLASLYGFLLVLLHYFFFIRLRFTSTFTRFIGSLIICLAGYCLILFPYIGLASRILQVSLLIIPIGVVCYLLTQKEDQDPYELL